LAKLLHVSDIHFGPKHLRRLSEAVLELAHAGRPDLVVVSGDLTQRAKPYQFREARAWLDRLPAPVSFVPGNHDVPMFRFWERFLSPFDAWTRNLAPELVRGYRDGELAVAGLNTAHAWTSKHGRVTAAEIAGVERELQAAHGVAARVVVAHHPLAGGERLGREPVARGGLAALERIARAGADLVLSGHLHHGFWLRPFGADGPLVAHAGTTTSSRGRGAEAGRNSLNWIELETGAVRLERRLWNPVAGRFEVEEAIELPRRAPVDAPPLAPVS